MIVHTSLSVVEKLLISSYLLEQKGKSGFTAEEIVVSAWENFPDTFGLRGFKGNNGKLMHPDSNRVFAEIMGSKPIRQRGLLEKIGTKKYQLTESGRELARLLFNRPNRISVEKAGLPRDIEVQIMNLMDSRAVKKTKSRREAELSFFDACDFWNISARSSSINLMGKLNNFEKIIAIAKEHFHDKMITFKHGGQTYNSQDLDLLEQIHALLLKRFEKDLNIIKERKVER